MPLIVKDLKELMAIQRVIMQAKFSELVPLDSAIPFSEPLANLAHRNIESIIATLTERGEVNEAKLWHDSIKIPSDWEGYEFIKNRIKATSSWSSFDVSKKLKFIDILCAPMRPSPEQIEELLRCNNET